MKAKEFIIEKLVKAGKKHRWMKYPMLALVSLVSLFFLLVEKCMEKPKRAVVALVCLVLIISQSWYLISMAGEDGEPFLSGNNGEEFSLVGDASDSSSGDASVDGSSDSQDDGSDASSSEDTTAADISITFSAEGMIGYTNDNDALFASNMKESDLAVNPYQLPTPTPAEPGCWKFKEWKILGTDVVIEEVDADTFDTYKDLRSGKYYFYLQATWERIGYKITYQDGSGNTVATDSALITDGAATLTLKGDDICTKTGSTYEQWIINGSYYDVNGEFTFGSSDVIATPDWIGNKYYIDFQKGHPDAYGEMESMYIPYGRPVMLNECTFQREGYTFAGWKIVSVDGVASGDDTIYPQYYPAENWSAVEDGHVVVEATWVYDYASISYNGEPFVYSETVSTLAEVKHTTVGGGKFRITLIGAQGETLDGTVDKDNLREVTGLDVQCSMLDDGNVIELETIDSGGIRTVTDENGITFSFMIEDLNNPLDENGQSTTVYLDLTVKLVPKELTVTDVGNKTKVYDGSNQIGVGAIIFTGAKEGDDIEVYSEEQYGYFADANAGEGKSITVSLSKYGAKADYYTVADEVTLSGIGTITKRTVGVTTAPVYPEGRDYFLTGEEPEYTVVIDADDLPESEDTAQADESTIIKAIQGHYTCGYKPNYQAGEFSIGIDNTVNLQNYTLDITQGTLRVQQETPVADYDYVITGNKQPKNVWYYGENPCITLTGTRDYDMVYITNDADSRAITYDSSKFKREAYVTEEMCSENADLYIQLANSKSHAVTSMELIEVYVDITAPVIDSDNIEVTPVNTGTLSKIGNFLSFGNFFKESLLVTIPVTDNLSGAESLTYYLDGNTSGDGVTVDVQNGKASFQITLKYKGTIALTTRDKAGNSSVLANLIGVEDSDYWVIENEAPEVLISAKDSDGAIVYSDETLYYKSVNVTASVTDPDAGVAYAVWSITKDGEAVTEDSKQVVADTNSLLTAYDFERLFTESGSYTVSVTAYDNSENESLPTETFRFSVDGSGPDIQVSPEDYDSVWSTEKTVTFTVSDAESGIDTVSLVDENGRPYPYTAVQGKENTYTFTVTSKGIYTIKAVDFAGNTAEVPLEFTKVSSEVPETPTMITNPMEPQNTESGWFTGNPEIIISGDDATPDGTKITNYYRLWKEGTEEPSASQIVNGSFQLPEEGIWNLRVWAVTESGMRSETENVYQIKYDGTVPVISDILIRGTGANAQVSFQVTDPAAGLATLEAVYNNDASNSHNITFKYAGNGVYTAAFTASMKGSYKIKATDAAGNTSYADAFEPMNIVVTKITGNAEEGIVVAGRVESGTFAIDSVAVTYGLSGQESSVHADELIVTTDADGDKAFTAKFTQLNENSRYDFLITAFAESGESCNYTGSFKTGITGESGVNVAGTVFDESMDEDDTSDISVVLYGGNDIVQIQNVKNNEAFIFTNVPDGAYTIRAIHGNRSVTLGIMIRDNSLVEPTDTIRLVLRDGKSTSVEYGSSDTKEVAVSGLENIFDDTTNFGSDMDYSIINAGGMVEFCMEINELSEGEVPAGDMVLISRNLRNNERVAAYMDFSIWKRRIGAFGIISETQVTSISGGKAVRITIPLSDELIANEGICVLRVHGGTVERLSDLDSNPNTYTIESTLFSTYALVYTDNSSTDNGNNNGNNNGNTNNPGGNGGNGITVDISKTPNTSANVSKSSSTGTSASPKTGDGAPIGLISILSVIMGAAGILLMKNKKRQ